MMPAYVSPAQRRPFIAILCVVSGLLFPSRQGAAGEAALPTPPPPLASLRLRTLEIPVGGVLVFWFGTGQRVNPRLAVRSLATGAVVTGSFEPIGAPEDPGMRFVPDVGWEQGAYRVDVTTTTTSLEGLSADSTESWDFEVVSAEPLPTALATDGTFTRQTFRLDIWCCLEWHGLSEVGPCRPTVIDDAQVFNADPETTVDDNGDAVDLTGVAFGQYLWRARTPLLDPPPQVPGAQQSARFVEPPVPGAPYVYELEGLSASGGLDVIVPVEVLSVPSEPPVRTQVEAEDQLTLNRCAAPPERYIDEWCDINQALCEDSTLAECTAYGPVCLGTDAPETLDEPVAVDLSLLGR